jgi:hypothetical protein
MTHKLIVIFIIAMLVLTACDQPAATPGTPLAWIDDPLDGMRLPLEPYLITLHSSDSVGITNMEVSINGVELDPIPNPNPEKLLVYLTQKWEPPAPGRYVIRARSQNTTGAWSTEDIVSVIVEDISTPTPVITVTPTLTPTVTLTPTLVPSTTPSPTPVPQTGFAGPPTFNPTQINLPYDCTSSDLTTEIKVNPGQNIKVMVLFYRVSDNGFTQHSEWADIAMNPVGADTYRITFNPIKAGGFKPWFGSVGASAGWQGWLQTQFVIQDVNGTYSRSTVYSLVKIAGCN